MDYMPFLQDLQKILLNFLPYILLSIAAFFTASSMVLRLLHERSFPIDKLLYMGMCYSLSLGFGLISLTVVITWREAVHTSVELANFTRLSFLSAAIFWISNLMYCSHRNWKFPMDSSIKHG